MTVQRSGVQIATEILSKGPLDYLLGKDRDRDYAKVLQGDVSELCDMSIPITELNLPYHRAGLNHSFCST